MVPGNFEVHHLEPNAGPHGGTLVAIIYHVLPLVEEIPNHEGVYFVCDAKGSAPCCISQNMDMRIQSGVLCARWACCHRLRTFTRTCTLGCQRPGAASPVMCGVKCGQAVDLVRQLHLHAVRLSLILLHASQEESTRIALPLHTVLVFHHRCTQASTHDTISLHLMVDRTPTCNNKSQRFKKSTNEPKNKILLGTENWPLRRGRNQKTLFLRTGKVLRSGTERTSEKSKNEILRSTETASEKLGY